MRQVDFSNAFVHATLPPEKEIYIELPSGFDGASDDGIVSRKEVVLKLQKSLYGIREAPLLWFLELKRALQNRDFVQQPDVDCEDSDGTR